MAAASRIRSGICWLLALELLIPAPRAVAAPSDGSTLAGDRGAVPAGGADSAPSADPFSGAATFAIPIALPPGTGGQTPELALRYSSALRADSWVGYGWTLGLPSIARSLVRGVPRYDDASDLFELDGQRLVPSASEPGRYHTRRESFARIIHESDGSWTVTRKDGTRLRFGLAAEARIQNAAGATFQWLLSEQEDARGNAFSVRYDRRDPGTAYPSEVRYTLRRGPGGGLASLDGDSARDRVVQLVLEQREDAPESHAAGFLRRLGHRLDRIDVRVAGSLLRRYDLRYAASLDSFRTLLSQVALYGVDAEASVPTPPLVTSFEYRSNVAAGTTGWALASSWSWPSGISLVRADRRDGGVRLADMDGDGRPDLVKAFGVQSGADFVASPDSGVYLNQGTRFAAAKSPAFTLPSFTGTTGNQISLAFAWEFPAQGVVWGNGMTPLDLTGDGRADFVGAIGFVPPYPAQGPLVQSFQGAWCRSAPGAAGGFACLDFPQIYSDGDLYTGKQGVVLTSGLQFQTTFFGGNARFADVDGDGLADFVVRGREIFDDLATSGSCSLGTTYSYVVYNRGDLHFERAPLDPASVATPGCSASQSVVSRDFQPCALGGDASCSLRVLQNATRLEGSSFLGWLWRGHPEYGNLSLDLDGDGLADHASATRHFGTTLRAAWQNDGARGLVSADAWSLPTDLQEVVADSGNALGSSRDLGVRLADVNGDGRVDVLAAIEGSARTTWLNDGDVNEPAAASPWVASAAWQLPAGLAFASAQGQDSGLRIEDLDGDGMADLVRSLGTTSQVWLARGEVPDLLTRVVTPLGGSTRFEYTPSTAFDHSGGDGVPDLPQVLQLVTAIETSDAVGAASRATLSYAGGLYDAVERELRGFREVTSVAPDGRITRTRYHQDAARAGLVESLERRDAAGALWLAVESVYTPDTDGPPYVSLPAGEKRLEYDGQSSPRRSRSAVVYDGGGQIVYGNPTARVEYGEVDAQGNDLAPEDTRTSELEYVLNPAAHLVDRVKRRVLRQGLPGSGVLLRETRLYYDDDATGTAPPTRGLVTRQVAVLGQSGRPDPTTITSYDVYGNPVFVTNPRGVAGEGGGTTWLQYDATFHAFVSAVVNPLGHRRQTFYGAATDCPVAYPAGAGIAQRERDPDLAASELGLRRCLDVFGRVVRERAPLDLAETTWSYVDTPGAHSVTRSQRSSVAGGVRSETMLLDGLGRPTQITSSGPQGRSVVVLRSYDASGRLASESAPFFSGTAPQLTTFAYDPLDRLRETRLPGTGRVTTLGRDRGLTTQLDASGRVRRLYSDPFGRARRLEEPNGAQTLITTFDYDASDALLQLIDPRGNATLLSYDRLGRRSTLLDPDTGTTTFRYDSNGNLVQRSDATGTTLVAYDDLDRPLERRVGGALEATWIWDTAPRGLGRLAARSDGAGIFRAEAYDALGRVVADSQEIAGTRLAFSTGYDPLGQITTRGYPSGRSVAWTRDARGYLTTIGVAGETPLASAIQWDARGRLAQWVGGNGVSSSASFDLTTGRLDTLDVRSGSGSVLERLRMGWDAGDRVTAVNDLQQSSRSRSFGYDGFGRLSDATGPYLAGFARITLRYSYDALGNLLCIDATNLAGCVGGTAMTYPGAGASRPHAPLSVNGLLTSHDASGRLTLLGARTYGYDGLGRLVNARDGGRELAVFAYEAEGRRAHVSDRSSAREIVRALVRDDFEWDRTRGLARLHVRLGGASIATRVEPFVPAGSALSAPAAPIGRGVLLGVGGAPVALATLLLSLNLLRRRRNGARRLRPALAGTLAIALYLDQVSPALALPDGDVNGDGRLDAADALLALRIASGALAPTAAQLEHGDVAPLDATPESGPLRIHPGDVLLLLRALRGDDVDGDGLAANTELALGASPFRADSDRDGLSDSFEAAFGTQPAVADSDADGVPDGLEIAHGSDPTSSDTDADGIADASDAQPLHGTVYRHVDHLGSSVLTTKADGTLLERVVYRPYGAIVPPAAGAAPAPGFGFGGQRFEAALAIYDFGARWYDPRMGRFLQPDSLVPGAARSLALNRYAYAFDDPLGFHDPSGNWPDWGGLWAGATSFLSSAASYTWDHALSPVVRAGWTAISSTAALGAAVAFGIPMDLYNAAKGALGLQSTDNPFQRYIDWASQHGGPNGTPAVAGAIGGVGSNQVNRSFGLAADLAEFALIDNIGNNFPSYARWLAGGGDPSGDTQGAGAYIKNLLDSAASGPVRLGCSSQGCAKVNAALQSLGQGDERTHLKRITLDAYGAGTRFSDGVRGSLGALNSFSNPGDIFVSLPFGEYLTNSETPSDPRFNPWPSQSHEFKAYCTPLGTCP